MLISTSCVLSACGAWLPYRAGQPKRTQFCAWTRLAMDGSGHSHLVGCKVSEQPQKYWCDQCLARRGRKLGVLRNLGESVFRGFQFRVFRFAQYPKPKTRSWKSRSFPLRHFGQTPSFSNSELSILHYTRNGKLGVENVGVFSKV